MIDKILDYFTSSSQAQTEEEATKERNRQVIMNALESVSTEFDSIANVLDPNYLVHSARDIGPLPEDYSASKIILDKLKSNQIDISTEPSKYFQDKDPDLSLGRMPYQEMYNQYRDILSPITDYFGFTAPAVDSVKVLSMEDRLRQYDGGKGRIGFFNKSPLGGVRTMVHELIHTGGAGHPGEEGSKEIEKSRHDYNRGTLYLLDLMKKRNTLEPLLELFKEGQEPTEIY